MADKAQADSTIEELFGAGGQFGKPEESEEDKVERAAHALREAVVSHKGRRKTLPAWKPVVAKVLRVTKLYQKRYDAVLARGEELGLFRIDRETLSYPIIVPLEPQEAPEEAEEESLDSDGVEVVYRSSDDVKPQQQYVSKVSTETPADWNPPGHLDCGHLNFSSDEENEAARAEGFCCHAGKQKMMPNYRRMTGEYRKPVPKSGRRTAEKVAMGGYPGLCCDDEGYYIGGIYNDCRREHPKDESKWCQYHRDEAEARRKARSTARTDPEEERPKTRKRTGGPRKRKDPKPPKRKAKGILSDADQGLGLMDASSALAEGVRSDAG